MQLIPKWYCTIIFYIRESQATLEFFHYTWGWLWYSQIFKQEVGLNHVQFWNLWISEPSLSKLEKFHHSLALPNIKYNCAILFWSQLYWLFIYATKYIFLQKENFPIDAHTKIGTEITVIGRNYWSSCRVLYVLAKFCMWYWYGHWIQN